MIEYLFNSGIWSAFLWAIFWFVGATIYFTISKFFAKKLWGRFVFILPKSKIYGPWFAWDQNKIDDMFKVYEEMGSSGGAYLSITDRKGQDFILPRLISSQTIVKVETKYRFF